MTKHLDLGCGDKPRNPFDADYLYGVDIRSDLGANIVAANLMVEPIPFPDDYFESISAYDFIEHIPRNIHDFSSGKTHFPFIFLMNEIFRTLKPNGIFYAVTPAYPHPKSFTDPTHINFFTSVTHTYFCGTNPLGRMYGFNGNFEIVRVKKIKPRGQYEPQELNVFESFQRLKDKLKMKRSHLIWELKKIKINNKN
jgi:SAM-dependent methyltransferase